MIDDAYRRNETPIRLQILHSRDCDPIDLQRPASVDSFTSSLRLPSSILSVPPGSSRAQSIHSERVQSQQMFVIDSREDHIEASETDHLLGWLPSSKTLTCTLSEPRDLLQNERTCLSFSKFSIALFFCAYSVILGFSFTDDKSRPTPSKSRFTVIVFSILVFLALLSLVTALLSYFQTVRRLTQRRIHTIGPHKGLVMFSFTAVMITLITVNSLLIAERYRTGH